MSPSEATEKQIERYRRMSGEQRLITELDLYELSCQVPREGIRHRYPNAPPARSAIISDLLVDCRVEVEVIAWRPLPDARGK